MNVEIKFEPSGLEGVVAVGSYLYDAAKRMGIRIEDDCGRHGQCDTCAVTVTKGMELLSDYTAAELEQLSESRRKSGERLSCQVKIEKEGELVVMVAEKEQTEEEKEAERKRKLRKEFEELPLEKKVSNLLELEAITLSETFSVVLNSPYTLVGKIMDVMAGFGLKMDKDAKNATRPAEHEEKSETKEAESADKPADDEEKQKESEEKGKATESVNEAS